MSYRSLNTNTLNASVKTLLKRGAHLGLGISAFTPVLALANPTGGQVVAGQANITAQNANSLVIHQASQSAIINWQQFNIGQGQYVQFLQPSSSSVVLNRVVGGSPTSILGNLSANGQVFLVNTNGVYFGKGASLDAQGFLASSLDINNSDFLNHNYVFGIQGANGATVVNDGSIKAHNGGYVVLAGDYASNTGIISAQAGHVILAAGSKATLSLNGNSLVNFAINQATLANYAGANNAGSLIADGGTVIMTADVANALKATVVNNTGLIEAKSLSSTNGKIYLTATGGNITNAGVLNANAGKTGAAGGAIVLKGDGKTTTTDQSQITATGLGAKGGHLELSGKTLTVRGLTTMGKGGNILLDPVVLHLTTGTENSPGTAAQSQGYVGVGYLESHMNAGTGMSVSATGRIDASGNVHDITATGTGGLTLLAGAGGIQLGGVSINIGGAFNAHMGYGSFGLIKAADVDLTASSHGNIELHNAVRNSKGVIKNYSVEATTGTVSINAGHVTTSASSGDLALKALHGDNLEATLGAGTAERYNGKFTQLGATIFDNKNIYATGDVVIAGSNGYVTTQGNIFANNVTITASGTGSSSGIHMAGVNASGNITLTAANGGISAGDVSAYGGIGITDSSGEGNVDLDHVNVGGNVSIVSKDSIETNIIEASGSIVINAHNRYTVAGSGEAGVYADEGVSITAGNIVASGLAFMGIDGGEKGVTLKGAFGSTEAGINTTLHLSADGAIKVDHDIRAVGGLQIDGKSLAYTGTASNFSMFAGYGSLNMDAAIGKGTAPVAYNVIMGNVGGAIQIQKSIFTAGSINATQSFSEGGFDFSDQGVLVRDNVSGTNITLSAGKSINLTATNIGIGNARGSSAEVGGVTLKAGKDINLTAEHVTSGSQVGNLSIRAAAAFANLGQTVDRSVLVQAGGTLNLNGYNIDIRGGSAVAAIDPSSGASGSAKATATTSLVAGKNINLSAGNDARISAGYGAAFVALESSTGVVSADASVSLSAGKVLTIQALDVEISAGYGNANAETLDGTVTATANVNVNLAGKTGVTITGYGSNFGSGVHFDRQQDGFGGAPMEQGAGHGGKATATLHGDVNVSGASIQVAGRSVTLSVGYAVAGRSNSSIPIPNGVSASGNKAVVHYTVTDDINFTAGAGGIQLLGIGSGEAGVRVHGGDAAAHNLSIDAAGKGALASVNVDASVNLVTTGDLVITGQRRADISGGSRGASSASMHADSNGHAKLTVNSGVRMAAANVTISSGETGGSTSISIRGGRGVLENLSSTSANEAGSVAINANSRVDITATGGIVLGARRNLVIAAGSYGGSNFGVGVGGAGSKLNLAFDNGVGLNAGSDISFFAGSIVDVRGGHSDGGDHGLFAEGGATLNYTGKSRVDITAGGAVNIDAFNVRLLGGDHAGAGQDVGANSAEGGATSVIESVDSTLNISAASLTVSAAAASFGAGAFAGNQLDVSATGASATASATFDSSLHITVTGAMKSTVGSNGYNDFFGGYHAGASNDVSASGGKANLTVKAGASIKAGSVLFSNSEGGNQSISGGRAAGSFGYASADRGGSANRSVDASVTITAKNGFTMQGGTRALIVADGSVGYAAGVSTSTGGKAASVISNNISISAKNISIDAHENSEIFGGGASQDQAGQAFVRANSGTASLTVNSAVSLTAANSISVNVDGVLNSFSTAVIGHLIIGAGGGASQVDIEAKHGGNAAMTVNEGVSLKSGLGGVTLTNGASHGLIEVAGASRLGGSSGFPTGSGSSSTFVRRPSKVIAGLGGGTATFTGNGNVNIVTTGALTVHDGEVGTVVFAGGSELGSGMSVAASAKGKATANIVGDVTVTTASALITGGSVVLAGGGVDDAGGASIFASHGGIASETVESVLKINATGAFTVSALDGLQVVAGAGSGSQIGVGFVGAGAKVKAFQGGAQASLTGTTTVQINAGSVSLTASGSLSVEGARDNGVVGQVLAFNKGDKASETLSGGVGITATTGGISLISNDDGIFVVGGGSTGVEAQYVASNAGATVSVNQDASVTFTAKKNVLFSAENGAVGVFAGSDIGSSDLVAGNGKGAVTSVVQGASVSITGANVTLNGHAGVNVSGGYRAGADQGVFGSHSGQATVTDTAAVSLKAKTNIVLTASSGHVFVRGGAGGFLGTPSSPSSPGLALVSASRHGVAAQATAAGVSLQAGGNITIGADGAVILAAGGSYSASVNATNLGTATLSHDAGVTVKATGSVTASGSFVGIFGGGGDRIVTNAFPITGGTHSSGSSVPSNSNPGGKVSANLTAGVTITAGVDVNLGGSSVKAVAGFSNQLFVGAERLGSFVGSHWNGGSANLKADTSVAVSAGNDINISAGSLQVLGMGGHNQANVNGGTSSAVANLSLKGNATFTAASDINITVGSNASIVGGALGNLRADHAAGHVIIGGSADASLNAGHDVTLDIGGSLTVAGINVNSSHAGSILADAHADLGFASVTAHADAGITAGHNIGGSVSGAINVVGGQFVSAVTLGLASSQHATATANASLTAGANITLLGGGDLTVAGGLFNSAAITNTFSNGRSASGERTASLQTKASITAGKTVSINVSGDAVIAGGDSLKAKASLSADSFMDGTATADAGVLIKGNSVNLTVGGNLLMRGGSGATAKALGIGTAINATATASADATISAKKNLTINVGHSGSGGDASFIGGSGGNASVQTLFSDNTATGTAHANVNVTGGKAVTLNVAGNLNVAGGPGAENSALVLAGLVGSILTSFSIGANSATAKANVSGAVNITAGTSLNVTVGNNINISGGSRGGNSAIVTATGGSSGGLNNTATMVVDTSVNLKGAKVTLTADGGSGNINMVTVINSSSSFPVLPIVASHGSTNVASAKINESINITATSSLVINGSQHTASAGTASSGNAFIDGTINIVNPPSGFHAHAVHPTVFAPMDHAFGNEGMRRMPEGVNMTPVSAPAAVPAVTVTATNAQLPAPAVTALDTVQAQGLVLDLVTLMATPSSQPQQSTAFAPADIATGYATSLPSSCSALLLRADTGSYRCSAGGK